MSQRFFQWVAGERRGEVVVFDEIVQEDGLAYITFKDGSRINSELIAEINANELTGKMVAEVESPNNIWGFNERTIQNEPRYEVDHETQEKFQIPSVEEIMTDGAHTPKVKKVIDLVPPRKTMNKFGRVATSMDLDQMYNESNLPGPVNQQTAPEIPQTPTKQTLVGDPVHIMMDKSKKADTEVNMTLTISLPSSHLFDVVRDSFEDGAKKALEYIIENIDISEIKAALKDGIEAMYGPNEDPNDNKIPATDLSQFKSPGISVVEDPNQYASGLFEPEVVEEPVIRDAKPEEAMNELSAELQEKADKINQENE